MQIYPNIDNKKNGQLYFLQSVFLTLVNINLIFDSLDPR